MGDSDYILPTPSEPEQTQLQQHPNEHRLVKLSLAIALLAAAFSGWQAWEAHRARTDAKTASDEQSKVVERATKAAETSAMAAANSSAATNTLAQEAGRSAKAAEQLAVLTQQALQVTTKSAKLTTRSHLTIINMIDIDPNNLALIVRNDGHSDARNIRALNGLAYVGGKAFEEFVKKHPPKSDPHYAHYPPSSKFPGFPRPHFVNILLFSTPVFWVNEMGQHYNLGVGGEARIPSHISPQDVEIFAKLYQGSAPNNIEIRGVIEFDDPFEGYSWLRWCYTVTDTRLLPGQLKVPCFDPTENTTN